MGSKATISVFATMMSVTFRIHPHLLVPTLVRIAVAAQDCGASKHIKLSERMVGLTANFVLLKVHPRAMELFLLDALRYGIPLSAQCYCNGMQLALNAEDDKSFMTIFNLFRIARAAAIARSTLISDAYYAAKRGVTPLTTVYGRDIDADVLSSPSSSAPTDDSIPNLTDSQTDSSPFSLTTSPTTEHDQSSIDSIVSDMPPSLLPATSIALEVTPRLRQPRTFSISEGAHEIMNRFKPQNNATGYRFSSRSVGHSDSPMIVEVFDSAGRPITPLPIPYRFVDTFARPVWQSPDDIKEEKILLTNMLASLNSKEPPQVQQHLHYSNNNNNSPHNNHGDSYYPGTNNTGSADAYDAAGDDHMHEDPLHRAMSTHGANTVIRTMTGLVPLTKIKGSQTNEDLKAMHQLGLRESVAATKAGTSPRDMERSMVDMNALDLDLLCGDRSPILTREQKKRVDAAGNAGYIDLRNVPEILSKTAKPSELVITAAELRLKAAQTALDNAQMGYDDLKKQIDEHLNEGKSTATSRFSKKQHALKVSSATVEDLTLQVALAKAEVEAARNGQGPRARTLEEAMKDSPDDVDDDGTLTNNKEDNTDSIGDEGDGVDGSIVEINNTLLQRNDNDDDGDGEVRSSLNHIRHDKDSEYMRSDPLVSPFANSSTAMQTLSGAERIALNRSIEVLAELSGKAIEANASVLRHLVTVKSNAHPRLPRPVNSNVNENDEDNHGHDDFTNNYNHDDASRVVNEAVSSELVDSTNGEGDQSESTASHTFYEYPPLIPASEVGNLTVDARAMRAQTRRNVTTDESNSEERKPIETEKLDENIKLARFVEKKVAELNGIKREGAPSPIISIDLGTDKCELIEQGPLLLPVHIPAPPSQQTNDSGPDNINTNKDNQDDTGDDGNEIRNVLRGIDPSLWEPERLLDLSDPASSRPYFITNLVANRLPQSSLAPNALPVLPLLVSGLNLVVRQGRPRHALALLNMIVELVGTEHVSSATFVQALRGFIKTPTQDHSATPAGPDYIAIFGKDSAERLEASPSGATYLAEAARYLGVKVTVNGEDVAPIIPPTCPSVGDLSVQSIRGAKLEELHQQVTTFPPGQTMAVAWQVFDMMKTARLVVTEQSLEVLIQVAISRCVLPVALPRILLEYTSSGATPSPLLYTTLLRGLESHPDPYDGLNGLMTLLGHIRNSLRQSVVLKRRSSETSKQSTSSALALAMKSPSSSSSPTFSGSSLGDIDSSNVNSSSNVMDSLFEDDDDDQLTLSSSAMSSSTSSSSDQNRDGNNDTVEVQDEEGSLEADLTEAMAEYFESHRALASAVTDCASSLLLRYVAHTPKHALELKSHLDAHPHLQETPFPHSSPSTPFFNQLNNCVAHRTPLHCHDVGVVSPVHLLSVVRAIHAVRTSGIRVHPCVHLSTLAIASPYSLLSTNSKLLRKLDHDNQQQPQQLTPRRKVLHAWHLQYTAQPAQADVFIALSHPLSLTSQSPSSSLSPSPSTVPASSSNIVEALPTSTSDTVVSSESASTKKAKTGKKSAGDKLVKDETRALDAFHRTMSPSIAWIVSDLPKDQQLDDYMLQVTENPTVSPTLAPSTPIATRVIASVIPSPISNSHTFVRPRPLPKAAQPDMTSKGLAKLVKSPDFLNVHAKDIVLSPPKTPLWLLEQYATDFLASAVPQAEEVVGESEDAFSPNGSLGPNALTQGQTDNKGSNSSALSVKDPRGVSAMLVPPTMPGTADHSLQLITSMQQETKDKAAIVLYRMLTGLGFNPVEDMQHTSHPNAKPTDAFMSKRLVDLQILRARRSKTHELTSNAHTTVSGSSSSPATAEDTQASNPGGLQGQDVETVEMAWLALPSAATVDLAVMVNLINGENINGEKYRTRFALSKATDEEVKRYKGAHTHPQFPQTRAIVSKAMEQILLTLLTLTTYSKLPASYLRAVNRNRLPSEIQELQRSDFILPFSLPFELFQGIVTTAVAGLHTIPLEQDKRVFVTEQNPPYSRPLRLLIAVARFVPPDTPPGYLAGVVRNLINHGFAEPARLFIAAMVTPRAPVNTTFSTLASHLPGIVGQGFAASAIVSSPPAKSDFQPTPANSNEPLASPTPIAIKDKKVPRSAVVVLTPTSNSFSSSSSLAPTSNLMSVWAPMSAAVKVPTNIRTVLRKFAGDPLINESTSQEVLQAYFHHTRDPDHINAMIPTVALLCLSRDYKPSTQVADWDIGYILTRLVGQKSFPELRAMIHVASLRRWKLPPHILVAYMKAYQLESGYVPRRKLKARIPHTITNEGEILRLLATAQVSGYEIDSDFAKTHPDSTYLEHPRSVLSLLMRLDPLGPVPVEAIYIGFMAGIQATRRALYRNVPNIPDVRVKQTGSLNNDLGIHAGSSLTASRLLSAQDHQLRLQMFTSFPKMTGPNVQMFSRDLRSLLALRERLTEVDALDREHGIDVWLELVRACLIAMPPARLLERCGQDAIKIAAKSTNTPLRAAMIIDLNILLKQNAVTHSPRLH